MGQSEGGKKERDGGERKREQAGVGVRERGIEKKGSRASCLIPERRDVCFACGVFAVGLQFTAGNRPFCADIPQATHTHTHTERHTHTQTRRAAHTHTCTHTNTQTHKHTHTHKHAHTCTHTQTQTHAQAH